MQAGCNEKEGNSKIIRQYRRPLNQLPKKESNTGCRMVGFFRRMKQSRAKLACLAGLHAYETCMRRVPRGWARSGVYGYLCGNMYESIADMVLNHQSRMSAEQQTLMHWY